MLKKKTVVVGLFLTIALAVGSMILSLFFFNNPRLDAASLYNAGVDALGAFVCAILFYGSMWQLEHTTRSFSLLVVMVSASFALNEWMWFTTGTPEYHTLYFWLCVLSKWFNLAMIYCFYLYVSRTMNFAGKLAKWANRAFPALLIVSMLIVLSNAFYPVSFFVDAEGVYGKGSLPWLEDLFLGIASLITTVLICRCTSTRRQKWAAMSFILIPIIEFLASGGAFAYATQYGAVLLSLILMYCILFNDRSRKLAATQTELTMATRIQAEMLPNIFPAFPGRPDFDVYASMDPAKEVGGDFYDFFLIDETHLGLVMADVSGKGVPAALFMMISKILVQNYAMTGMSPAQVLQSVNNQICSNNREEMFVTVWFGILDTETGKITAANAGHEYPVLMQPEGRFELVKDKHGLVIGAMDGVRYKEYELRLQKGSKLFLYTDGVPEATNAKNELFGTDRMLAALNEDPGASPETILHHVRRAVDGFVLEAEQFDDLTMLCLEYKGGAGSSGRSKELSLPAEAEKLPELLSFLERELEEAGCPMKTQTQICVAAEEIFVNIANYAYAPGKGVATVRLAIREDPATAAVTFIDRGLPFDPLKKEDPDVTLSAEEREIGGLGIYMTKKTMDEVLYEYKDGQNRLTLVKKLL